MGFIMNNFLPIFLALFLLFGFSDGLVAAPSAPQQDGGAVQDASVPSDEGQPGGAVEAHLGGQALLEEDKKQIAYLEEKKQQLESQGADTAAIEGYIELANEMMELNNERHALHEAAKKFAEAVGIVSGKIETNIQKVNKILEEQAKLSIKIANLMPKNNQVNNKNAGEHMNIDNSEPTQEQQAAAAG